MFVYDKTNKLSSNSAIDQFHLIASSFSNIIDTLLYLNVEPCRKQSRSTPTSGPPQSKRKSPCAQVISL